ncbi:MAG: hypothetical protein C0524_02190 [Rhodobacter sp.]|nr:hypothetical protein [Rhodobacter sp.]
MRLFQMSNGFPTLSPRAPPPACFVLAIALALPSSSAAEALGVSDPVISYGLTSISDWSTALPLLDRARMMRPFFAYANDDWETLSNSELAAGGHLDLNGYPIRIPPGMKGIRTIWAWDSPFGAKSRAGRYVLTHAGSATLEMGGNATVVSSAPGRIIFDNAEGGPFWLNITRINPDDPIRQMSLLRADHIALAEAGAVFDPDWLAVVTDARELRFMDWMETNNSEQTVWNDRPKPDDATWSGKGVPVELMVRLANEAGIDPWFTMPHKADEDYNRRFASYVRDQLDPRLKAHVEYSNEHWNGSFGQFQWLREMAIAEWGEEIADDWESIFAYQTKAATELALIWEDVYKSEAPARLVNVLGTQSGNAWLTDLQLTSRIWESRDPDAFTPPETVFEEVAGTLYFGGSIASDPALRAELVGKFAESPANAFAWLYETVSQRATNVDTVPDVLEMLSTQRQIANRLGLRFVAYEGGQHMHHSFGVEGMSEEEAEALLKIMEDFVRSSEMGALYSQLWDGWRDIGDGPFMQFVEMGAPSRWGSWGLFAYPGDSTPRSRFLTAMSTLGKSWWGEGGGPQYLHGITASVTEGADRIVGTDEEDYLAGLGGDDTFVESSGRDGLNGGLGTDTYVLLGPREDYGIEPEGKGIRVTGPDQDTWLVNFEVITFGDGTSLALD